MNAYGRLLVVLAGLAAFPTHSTGQSKSADYVLASIAVDRNTTRNIQLPKGYTVSGRLIDSQGAALAAVVVATIDESGFLGSATVSASDGAFTLLVRPGTHSLLARPAAVAAADLSQLSRLVPLVRTNVVVSRNTSLGDIRLSTGYIVRGRLRAAASYVYGAVAAVERGTDGLAQIASTAAGKTQDTISEYAVAVPAGQHDLVLGGVSAYDSRWKVAPLSSFVTNRLQVSRDTTFDIRIPTAHPISGTVKDSAGSDLSGFLYVHPVGVDITADPRASAVAVRNGAYLCHLPVGRYELVFVPVRYQYSGRGCWTRFDVTVTKGGGVENLVTQDGVLLSGKVLGADKRPAQVLIELTLPSATPDQAGIVPILGWSDEKGLYTVAVPPNTYALHVRP